MNKKKQYIKPEVEVIITEDLLEEGRFGASQETGTDSDSKGNAWGDDEDVPGASPVGNVGSSWSSGRFRHRSLWED